MPNLEKSQVAPVVAVTHSVAQAIPSSANTALTWDTERSDAYEMHDAGSPTRVKCVKAGWHLIQAHFGVAANATGARYAGLSITRAAGGGAVEIASVSVVPSGTIDFRPNLPREIYMVLNDYIEVTLYQNSGGDLDVVKSGERSPEFTVQWLRG